jgi:hypothetical protein
LQQANAGNKSAGVWLSMQRRRADEIKRCDSSQGDTSMNRTQYPLTIVKHAHIAAAMFAVVLAFAGVANAHAMSLAHAHKAKKGHLTIMASTEVGGTILQAGEYEVREAKSSSGPVIEFVHQFRNESASELVQADQEEVVAQMQFTKQELNSPSKQTQLMLASWYSTEAIGVEIRGNAVGYVFAAPQLAAQSDTAEVKYTNGAHE